MIKALAFDVFGTVFDLSGVDKEEIRDYGRQLKQPIWQPVLLPKSWEFLPAHPDSRTGIEQLRRKFIVVTCSNGPIHLLTKLSRNNRIDWDFITPIELRRVYKPNPSAYALVCESLNLFPEEVMFVTANPTFGDMEGSKSLGMQPQLIRNPGCPQTIIELAEYLGC